MAGKLAECPDCRRLVSLTATACPNCGRAFKEGDLKSSEAKGVGPGCIIVIVLFVLFLILAASNSVSERQLNRSREQFIQRESSR